MTILNNDRGLTLIEMMVALFVFSVGILALYSLQLTAIKGNHTANSISNVTTYLSDQIERLYDTPFSSLTDSNVTTNLPAGINKRALVITNSGNNTKECTVTVYYNSSSGERSIQAKFTKIVLY